MTKPLHQRIDTPSDDEETGPPATQAQSQLEHHLAGLETWLGTIQDRIDEVRQASKGEDVKAHADGGPPGQTVAAGRLVEALHNAARAAGHVYALCALLARDGDE